MHPSPHFNDVKMARFCSFAPPSLLWGEWGVCCSYLFCPRLSEVHTGVTRSAICALQITSEKRKLAEIRSNKLCARFKQNWKWKSQQVLNHVLLYHYSGFPKETPELKFRLRFFFRSATVCNSLINTHARRFDSDEHMAWCNGGRRKVYAVEDQHKYCV